MARVTSSSSGGTVSIQDSSGNPLTSSSGALNVNLVQAPADNISLVTTFNEVTNVASGIETTVVTYTANDLAICFIERIMSSGTNVSEYRLYRNADIIDKKYSSYTEYNVVFEFSTGDTSAPGLKIGDTDVIYLKAIHTRPSVGSFNANILVLEVS